MRKQWGMKALAIGLMLLALGWIGLNVRWQALGQGMFLTATGARAGRITRASMGAPAGAPAEAAPAEGVHINSATFAELSAIFGVGPAMAQAILDEREAGGPFFFPEDLLNVKGIGPKKLAVIAPQITLE